MEIRHWGARSRQELADWLSGVLTLPGDEPVAAPCCLTYDLPLATLNLKDYEDFKIHHGLRILGAE